MSQLGFSVVIPCYNAQDTLVRAVQSCFMQRERSLEVILINDASLDATANVMAELAAMAPGDIQVHCVNMPVNGGPSRARNHGWDIAQGDYIAFLDADDCWDEDRLVSIRQVLIKGGNGVVLVGHPHRQIDQPRVNLPLRAEIVSVWRLLLRNLAQTSCVVVRRDLSLRFDTDMRHTEDHDLWFRVASLGQILYLPNQALTRLGRPQMSAGGLSGHRWAMRRGELYFYTKAARQDARLFMLLPALWGFSLCKHFWAAARLRLREMV